VRILVVNAGSSSLKLRWLESGERKATALDLPWPEGDLEEERVLEAIASSGPVDAVGHRVVHGGPHFRTSVRIDSAVVEKLKSLVDLAPLHQPRSLRAISVLERGLEDVPGVACFDTAFHSTLPEHAATYPLPARWIARFGLRRYGFHGLSHSYASRRACELAGVPVGASSVVSCHLGAGASLAAVKAGVSVDTTMGFTPLEGLMMATRSGTIDPGIALWLLQHGDMSAETLERGLVDESGLVGLAGSADMRAVLEAAGRGETTPALAIDVYVHRLTKAVAEMAAAMGGANLLVFTGGVGENAPEIRARALGGLAFLGASVDRECNEDAVGDREIGDPDSRVRVFVVEAREDLEIAREVSRLLEPSG
jgi:acetate kinase